MKLIRKLLLGSLAVVLSASFCFSKSNILWQNEKDNKISKSAVLDKVLNTDKATGYAGVLPICKVGGKRYALLGQERNNGSATGTYADFGGKVDPSETLGTAALREFYEETSRVYDYRARVKEFMDKSHISYGPSSMTAFLDVDYKPSSVFMDALKAEKMKKNNGHFYEKSDFIWVEIDSLYESTKNAQLGGHPWVSANILRDDGTVTQQKIKLRSIISKTLKNSTEILKKYTKEDNANIPNNVRVAPNTNTNTNTNIQRIKSLKEIDTSNFKKNTLVLLDLDENIFYKGHKLIEKDIAKTIKSIKSALGNKSNVTILGLTKRSSKSKNGFYDKAHKHLKDYNISVSRNRFKKFNGMKLNNNSRAGFIDGVIYTNGQDKGNYLESFLKKTGFKPSRIVMSDDIRQNLIDVKKFANKIKVPMDAYEMIGANNH